MSPWAAIAAATAAQSQQLAHDLGECATAQRRQLSALLQANAATDYGRRFGFASIADPDRYRSTVPLCRYEDIAAEIDAMATGKEQRLLGEQVVLYEETGGSSGVKLIPYGESSLAGFRRAVHPWLHNLMQHYPELGRAYFAISPANRAPRTTRSGVAVGAASDAIYFGRQLQQPLGALAVIPEHASAATAMAQWQYYTLLALLRAEDLTLLSAWSPTFIITLLEVLPLHAEALLRELHEGSTGGGACAVDATPERAATVARALAGERPDTRLLWPRLQLISCWTHASAARFIPELRRSLPGVAIQGKGLLSTEGVVSIPLQEHDYPVLALHSGFYEFLDDKEHAYLAHELVSDREYEVVMSVPGLYRYRSGDRVRVRGWAGTTPQLEFTGRAGLVSDLVGEKLDDAFVADCLQGIEGFAMLAPVATPRPRYRLYVEDGTAIMEEQFEQRLRRNPQYAYARDLGQLDAVQVVRVGEPMQRYQAWALARGQRLGDIKPPSLRTELDWEQWLGGC